MNFIVATRKASLFVGFGMSQVPQLLLWKKKLPLVKPFPLLKLSLFFWRASALAAVRNPTVPGSQVVFNREQRKWSYHAMWRAVKLPCHVFTVKIEMIQNKRFQWFRHVSFPRVPIQLWVKLHGTRDFPQIPHNAMSCRKYLLKQKSCVPSI